jgi:hypothetical protein
MINGDWYYVQHTKNACTKPKDLKTQSTQENNNEQVILSFEGDKRTHVSGGVAECDIGDSEDQALVELKKKGENNNEGKGLGDSITAEKG